jgi:hypothetical protein
MNPMPDSERQVLLCLWLACGLAAVGGVAATVLPAGGENRVAGMAIPFWVAAAALAANALTRRRGRWLAAVLYAVAGFAVAYGVMLGVSVPVRLSVEGKCAPLPAPCPLGFDRPLSASESLGLEVAAVCGVLTLLLTFLALEFQYRPRLSLFGPRSDPPRVPPGPER